MQSGERLLTFEGHEGKEILCAAWSPDGELVARGDNGGAILLSKADTGTQATQPLRGHVGRVFCICFGNKIKRLLASGSSDRTIKIWEIGEGGAQATLRLTLEGHTDSVMSIALSPDDRYMAIASDNKTVGLWDVVAGHRVRVLEGHSKRVNSVAWSRDGRCIVSGSSDGTVRVWEADVQVYMNVWV